MGLATGKEGYLKRGWITTIYSMCGTTCNTTDRVSGTQIINSVHFTRWELKGGTFVMGFKASYSEGGRP